MNRPYVSVVIDNHNYGRFLRQAIDSVLGQDFPGKDVELIVVDDGSSDDSRAILASYGKKLKAVLQDRQGQASAFNRGFAEARGEVVCLLDSDDVWLPGKLAKTLPRFDDKTVGVTANFLQDADAALHPIRFSFPNWPERYRLEDFLDGRVEFTATSGLAYRKAALDLALPIPRELFYYLDDFLTARVLFDYDLANVPEVLGLHRVHGGNWCAGGYRDPRKIEVDFRMREIFSGHLQKWLAAKGKSFTERYRELESLELLRRRVLYEALNAKPLKAWEEWLGGYSSAKSSSFGRFRLMSLLLAVLSPTLYFTVYSVYAEAQALRSARLRLFPED